MIEYRGRGNCESQSSFAIGNKEQFDHGNRRNLVKGGVLVARCGVCDKGVVFGSKISHSHRRSNRAWKPNIKRVRVVVNGANRHMYVCTKCLRSNRVVRA